MNGYTRFEFLMSFSINFKYRKLKGFLSRLESPSLGSINMTRAFRYNVVYKYWCTTLRNKPRISLAFSSTSSGASSFSVLSSAAAAAAAFPPFLASAAPLPFTALPFAAAALPPPSAPGDDFFAPTTPGFAAAEVRAGAVVGLTAEAGAAAVRIQLTTST